MKETRRTIGALALALLGVLAMPAGSPAAPGQISGAPLVYLRTGAGPTEEPLGVLSEGTRLETLGVDGAWTRVRVEDGREGFVYSTFIEELPDPTPTPAPLVEAEPPEASVGEIAPDEGFAAGGTPLDDPPPPTPDPFLLEEVARLRTEIDSLKRTVSDELTGGEAPGSTPEAGEGDSDAGLRMGAVALVSLAIGWFLGVVFARRRAQRSRLRF